MSTKVKTRRKVALLVETSRSYGRGALRGIARFAQTRGNWSLLHQEMTIDVELPDWLQESEVHGVIARVDARTIELRADLGAQRLAGGQPEVHAQRADPHLLRRDRAPVEPSRWKFSSPPRTLTSAPSKVNPDFSSKTTAETSPPFVSVTD